MTYGMDLPSIPSLTDIEMAGSRGTGSRYYRPTSATSIPSAHTGISRLRQSFSMHVLRHSAAMRLLRAGIETSVIALWLGHEQVETTHIYLHADMGIKERALAATAPAVTTPGRFRPNDKLLAFLEAL